ncbi:RNA polymerase sigma factor [Thalassotalea ganghwensis]
MKLKARIQGWVTNRVSAEYLLTRYQKTKKNRYLTLLVEQYNRSLYHYLLTMSDQVLAEDVLQSTWLTVVEKARSVQAHTNVKSWLFTIARHRLIDELRRKKRWSSDSFDEAYHSNSSEPSLDSFLMNEQQLDRFNRALDGMALAQRESFILQQEGFSINEISQLTDVEQETVKSRLRYARQHLRKHLGYLT